MRKIIFLIALCVMMPAALFSQTVWEDAVAQSRMALLRLDGLTPLRFVNALDGKPVDGATITIDRVGQFTTDRAGIISFPEQEDGMYTLEFSKPGFITSRIEFEIIFGLALNGHISVSPVMRGDYMRIVLDWGRNPADLDIHLVKEGSYHISYRNMRTAADGSVVLDRDAMNGFGPETITLMETDLRAVYRLYIHDYTNRGRGSSRALSRSGATVRVYGRNGLLRAFRVPGSHTGDTWNVFRIVNGRIVE
jgi:hypothetical protein